MLDHGRGLWHEKRNLVPDHLFVTTTEPLIASSIASPPTLPEVWVAGFLQAGLGLGETGRLVVQALESVGVPVHRHVYEKSDVAGIPFEAESSGAEPVPGEHPGLSVLCLNGEHLSVFASRGGEALLAQRYVISIWFWETEELPLKIAQGFDYVDEVWVATPFVQQALQPHSGTVPVRLFPHPLIPLSMDPAEARARFPFEDRFVFLFSFDYHSCVKRKNPQAVCAAFAEAFPIASPTGPICIIKSINGHHHPADLALLKRRWVGRPDLIFIDEFYSTQDRNLLLQRADAYVSLHRAEGLGLTMLEAMSAGKPTIGTAYSGNVSFMTEEHSWLIPFTRSPVGKGSLYYASDTLWAEPDVAAAASAMRQIFDHPELATERGAKAQKYVLTHHSLQATGTVLKNLLSASATQPIRPKQPPVAHTKWRAETFAALAKIRRLEEALDSGGTTWRPAQAQIRRLREEALSLSKAHRKALSLSIQAAKHEEQKLRDQMASMQNTLDRLSAVVEEFIARSE